MRCKHYFGFGKTIKVSKVLDQNEWNRLRVNEVKSPFTLERTLEEYEDNCKNSLSYKDVAMILCKEFENCNATKIVSCGVGKGILEWHISKMMPKIEMDCTDYASEGVNILKNYLPNCNVYTFDMINGNYSLMSDCDFLILYRVSTEFDKDTWKDIFERIHNEGINKIIFVPTGIDTWKDMIKETWKHWKRVIKRKNETMCGWLYSEKEFHDMWKGFYCVEKTKNMDKTKIFYLTRLK